MRENSAFSIFEKKRKPGKGTRPRFGKLSPQSTLDKATTPFRLESIRENKRLANKARKCQRERKRVKERNKRQSAVGNLTKIMKAGAKDKLTSEIGSLPRIPVGKSNDAVKRGKKTSKLGIEGTSQMYQEPSYFNPSRIKQKDQVCSLSVPRSARMLR